MIKKYVLTALNEYTHESTEMCHGSRIGGGSTSVAKVNVGIKLKKP